MIRLGRLPEKGCNNYEVAHLFSHPYYVRYCTTVKTDWFSKPNPSAEHFARQLFNLTRADQSVYEVSDEIEEVRAMAAHVLADTGPELENCYLIRFSHEDILESGVTLRDSELGETGVVLFDHRHRDMVGTRNQLEAVMGKVITRLHEGQDRVRWLKKVQLEFALNHFLRQETRERPTHTAHWCQCLLNTRDEALICGDRYQIEAELATARIPEEAIRRRAGARWLKNGGQFGGAGVDDWLAAEMEMRNEYRAHYLACHLDVS